LQIGGINVPLRATRQAAGRLAAAANVMTKKHVLLVEDDRTSARLYQTLLERHDCAVTVVPDGSDAFMEAHRQEFDIILLDLMLPNMDGLAMLTRLRAQRRFARTPIFLHTSADLSRVETLAAEAGVTRVFSKDRPAQEVVKEILGVVAGISRPATGAGDETDTGVGIRRDFRVPAGSSDPQPTLRMAPVPEPPPPPPPVFRPVAPPVEEEEKVPEKPGLLSRIFKPRPADE